MTTLADLTPEERAQCRGMWCDTPKGRFILLAPMFPDREAFGWQLLAPSEVMKIDYPPEKITPRFDLPRAWAPDGQPVPGEWEDGHVVVSYDDPDPGILKNAVSIEGLSEGGMSYYDAPPNGIEVKLDKFGEGEGKARRFVGEWEQA